MSTWVLLVASLHPALALFGWTVFAEVVRIRTAAVSASMSTWVLLVAILNPTLTWFNFDETFQVDNADFLGITYTIFSETVFYSSPRGMSRLGAIILVVPIGKVTSLVRVDCVRQTNTTSYHKF